MNLGCSVPAQTFMPEFKGNRDSDFADIIEKCRTAARIGYDYAELSVGAVNGLTENEAAALAQAVKDGEFALYACNSFVSAEIKLCTEDFSVISEFVKRSMHRLNKIGVREVIFGSGYARKRPDGMSESEAMEKIERFLLLCSDEGSAYGITTCVEPLNSTETNIINTASDAAALVRRLNRGNIKLLPDLFHMCMENEDPAILIDFKDITAHLHASEAPGRVYPGKFGGEYLKKAAEVYTACGSPDITVECVFGDFEPEAILSYKFMRNVYE